MNIVPIYVACDVGIAMSGARSTSVEKALQTVLIDVVDDPWLDQRLRLSLTYFNDGVIRYMPLKRLSNCLNLPSLPEASGGTSYSTVMNFLGEVIEPEMRDLMDEGKESVDPFTVIRPILIMLAAGTDPGNLDDRRGALDISSRFRPNFVALDLSGDVTPSLRQMSPIGVQEMVYSIDPNVDTDSFVATVEAFLRTFIHGILRPQFNPAEGRYFVSFNFPRELNLEFTGGPPSSKRDRSENDSISLTKPEATRLGSGVNAHERSMQSDVGPRVTDTPFSFSPGGGIHSSSRGAWEIEIPDPSAFRPIEHLEEIEDLLTDINPERAKNPSTFDEGFRVVLPIYIVCEASSSMFGGPIEAVNNGIVELLETIVDDPVIDQKARVSIIEFNFAAHVLLPLTTLSEVASIPQCEASGSTSYLSAFRLVKSRIDTDVDSMRREHLQIYRPWVFFIACAPSLEPWESAHDDLVSPDNQYRPHIASFGFAAADGQDMVRIATALHIKPLVFHAVPRVPEAALWRETIRYIFQMMMVS